MTQFSYHSNSCHVNTLRNAYDFWTVCSGIVMLGPFDYGMRAFILQQAFLFQAFILCSYPQRHVSTERASFQQITQGHVDRKHACGCNQTLY